MGEKSSGMNCAVQSWPLTSARDTPLMLLRWQRLRRNRSLCSLLPILKPAVADIVSSLRITDIKTFCGLGSSQKLQPTPAEKRRLLYLQRVFVVLFFIHMMGTIA